MIIERNPRRHRPWLLPAVAGLTLAAALTIAYWPLLDKGTDIRDILRGKALIMAHAGFRDQVLDVVTSRFHVAAAAVPNEADEIEIGDRRRNLAELFDVAIGQPEPRRRDTIYRWFLGDPATVGRFVVRDPAETLSPLGAIAKGAPLTAPGGFGQIETKKVETLSVRPDGTIRGSSAGK